MLIAIAALTLNLDLASLLQKRVHAAPVVKGLTCQIETVSYRFVGQPGTEFHYDGDTFHLPQAGSIELVASSAVEYEVNGRKLPLKVWPKDSFGMRTIPLPKQQQVN
jgi:hypothetical protein